MFNQLSQIFINLASIFELILVIIVAGSVLISFTHLIFYFPGLRESRGAVAYQTLREFLGHVLQTVISVELMLMLLERTIDSILYLVLFVIARKMLIYSETMKDLLIGSLAITIIGIMLLVINHLGI